MSSHELTPPGLGEHPSLSMEKIDDLLSAPVRSATLQMPVAASPPPQAAPPQEPRYSYEIKANSIVGGTSNPQWNPLHLRTAFIWTNVALLVFFALLIELLYFMNVHVNGMVPSHYVRWHPSFWPYLTVLPGVLAILVVLPWFEIDRLVKVVQPYVSMSRTRTLAGNSVLLNYNDRYGLFALPKIIRNKHATPLLTTLITTLAVLVVPFSAGYMRLGPVPDGVFINLSGVTQVDELTVPTYLPYAQINAAAAYVGASAVYGLNPPQLTWFNGGISWTAAAVNHPNWEYEGLVSANTVVVQSYPSCVIIEDATFSNSIIKGNAYGTSFSINTTDTASDVVSHEDAYADPSYFGVYAVGTSSSPNSVAPVIFWDIYQSEEGAQIALAVGCNPSVIGYRANVIVNSTNDMVMGIENVTPITSADLTSVQSVGDSATSTWQVSSGLVDMTGTALNGLFLNNPVNESAVMDSIRSTITYAIDTQFRNNLAAGSFGAEGALVESAEVLYGQFLGVAARALYFQAYSGSYPSTTGSYHPTDEQRIYVSASVTHVLFVFLILMALMGGTVAKYNQHDRKQYKLFAAPGSIAQAVAISATSDLPTIVRSTDRPEDLKSVLQEYTFTLNKETGGLILGDRDPATIPNSPTHIPMTGVSGWMKDRLAHARGGAA